MAQLGELKEYAGYYIAAKLDAIRVSVRNLGIWIALGLVGLLGVATVVVAAVVLLLWGIAGALAQVFPAHPWLGNLIVGAVVLLATVIGILFCMRAITRTFKSTTVDKYENRQRQQRQRFGHDVRSPSTTRHPTGPTH
jgi:membrane protein implicated in regulation of membrane protease activity